MNKCVLIGRLTKDLDLRYTPSGTAVAKFTLAVDRPRRSDRFHPRGRVGQDGRKLRQLHRQRVTSGGRGAYTGTDV
jgi:hypothetical protein